MSILAGLNLSELEKQNNLPSGLLSAVAQAESAGNPNAVSPKGALGLFQFMPETAKAYGVNPYDPQSSAVGAARMYGDLSKQFNGDIPSMLAAYNWGSGNLTKQGLQNAPKETRDYIAKITAMLPKQYADSGEIMNDASKMSDEELMSAINAPESMSDEELLAAIGQEAPKGQKDAPMQFGEKTGLESLRQGLGRGASFGLLDEATAAIMTPFLKEEGQSYGDAYSQLLEDARQSQGAAKESNPMTFGAGELTGALATGIAATPQGALARYAATSPIKSGAALGGVSGGVYGFGTGEGSAENRALSAATGGALGAAGGAAIPFVGKNIVEPAYQGAKSGLSKLSQKFGKKPVVSNKVGMVDDSISAISEQPLSEVTPVSALTTEKGNVLNLPKGVIEKDVNLLRVQEEARQGALGQASQQAQKQIDDAIVTDVKKATQSLIGKETTDNPDDILLRGIDAFKKQAIEEKKYAGDLMKLRNDKIAQASIYKDYTRSTLTKGIDDLLKAPDNAVFTKTTAAKPILEYKKILDNLTKPNGTKFARPIKFDELQGWSSSVSKFAREAKQSGREQEAAVANQMVGKYNDWLDNITKEAFKSGDDDLVESIFKANRNYVDFKKKFGTNRAAGESKILEDIIKKEALTPDQIVNMTFGKSAMGKDTTNQLIGRMLKSVPEEKQTAMVNDFRSGLIMRAYKDSLNADGSLKLGTFANKLRDTAESPAFKTHLSDPEYDAAMKGLYQDISSYVRAINDPTVRSTSGTGGVISRVMTKILDNPAIRQATIGQSSNLNAIVQSGLKANSRAQIKQIEKEFFNGLDEAINGKSTLWSTSAPVAIAPVGAIEPEQELPQVDLPRLGL